MPLKHILLVLVFFDPQHSVVFHVKTTEKKRDTVKLKIRKFYIVKKTNTIYWTVLLALYSLIEQYMQYLVFNVMRTRDTRTWGALRKVQITLCAITRKSPLRPELYCLVSYPWFGRKWEISLAICTLYAQSECPHVFTFDT